MDRIPGADTLGFGFDITKRYSEDSTTKRIFKEGDGDSTTITIGTRTYAVPENVAVEPIQKSDRTSQVFSTRQQVQDHFSAKAGVTASGFGFKGQFEASYSQITKKDRNYFYALTEAETHNYNLKLKEHDEEWLTAGFAKVVDRLPEKFTPETADKFFAFFAVYGTHYVHQVKMGGSLYYYVATEKTTSSEEKTIKAKMELEYKAVFAKSKAEAESTWKQVGKEWAESRTVRIVTSGGDIVLDGVTPGFGDWDGEAFAAWGRSLDERPGFAKFNLLRISKAVPFDKVSVVDKALTAYLQRGLVVKADRYRSLNDPARTFIAASAIDGPTGVVAPPTPAPLPPKPSEDVNGIQVALFDSNTFEVLLNKVYYSVGSFNPTDTEKMYKQLHADVRSIGATDYYCALSIFGLSPAYYPPADVTGWMRECGAELAEWKKYISLSSWASGAVCYTFAGQRGVRGSGVENFIIDGGRTSPMMEASSLFFFRTADLVRKLEEDERRPVRTSRPAAIAQP